MSGPALPPLANIAPTAKGADSARSDASATSGTDAADNGFAHELQRQISNDTKPRETTPPVSKNTKNSDQTSDSKATAEADAAASASSPVDQQSPQPQPDLAALLGNLVAPTTTGNNPLPSLRGDKPTKPIDDVALGTPADATLAALVAASENPRNSPAAAVTATLKGETEAPSLPNGRTDRSVATVTFNNGTSTSPVPENGLQDLADSGRPNAKGTAPEGIALVSDSSTFSAKLAAPGETAGKATDMAAEIAPTNNFASMHAAALANLRGESPAQAPSPVPLHVATPAGSPGWPEEVGNRVSWMVGHEESHAQLTLTPPQLGKIEVSITVNGDQTSAQFVAATPAARELIEQSLPRLREVLEQSGINLGQTDVGTSSQSNNSGDGQRGNAWGSNRGSDDGSAPRVSAPQWGRRGDGLVDTFA